MADKISELESNLLSHVEQIVVALGDKKKQMTI